MRRILSVSTVAVLMVAMLLVMAVPGFAAEKCDPIGDPNNPTGFSCRGGEGARGGTVGGAGQGSFNLNPDGTFTTSGTGGGGNGAGGPGVQQGGGGGGKGEITVDTDPVPGNATFDAQGQGGSGSGGHTAPEDGGSGGQCSFEDNDLVVDRGSRCPFLS